MSFSSISPQELSAQIVQGQHVDLVDVRSPGEYAAVHAVGARSLPMNQTTSEAVRAGRPADATGPTYVICQSGGRSRRVCQRLVDAGLPDVVNVDGGTAAWNAAGLPVESSARSPAAGLPGWARASGILLVFVCLMLALTGRQWFGFIGLGIWILLLIGGRGACPFNACATSTASAPKDRT